MGACDAAVAKFDVVMVWVKLRGGGVNPVSSNVKISIFRLATFGETANILVVGL